MSHTSVHPFGQLPFEKGLLSRGILILYVATFVSLGGEGGGGGGLGGGGREGTVGAG